MAVLCAGALAAPAGAALAPGAGAGVAAGGAGGSGSGAGTHEARRHEPSAHARKPSHGKRERTAPHKRKRPCKKHKRCKTKKAKKKKKRAPEREKTPPGGGSGGGEGGGETSEGTPGPPSASEPLRLFSATSFYNEQLPASAPLAANSSQIVANFMQQLAASQGKVVINTTQWSTPVYTVGADAPTVAMVGQSSICSRPEGVFAGFQEQIEAVPIPADALPAAGSDKEVVVWQPSTDQLWELWRVIKENGRWSACWGGRMSDVEASEGTFPAPYGAAASGLSLLGGQIHLEDLEHGHVDHALELLLPSTAAGEFVWPADRTDGSTSGGDAIPEGTRLRLPASLDLNSLHLSPSGLAIATAIQRYGMIVADTGGSVALSAQDTTPLIAEGHANPYETLLPNPYDTLDDVPWEKLEVVSPSYHG